MVREKGKRIQITFRLTETAWNKLRQVSMLFNMESSQYVKAVLYKDLGLFQEPVDQRRRRWIQKRRTMEDENKS